MVMDEQLDAQEESNPRKEIIDLLHKSMTTTRRRMEEIKNQIDSMQTSVDKEQNRYSSIAMELRNIKDNLDTVPREDIRDKYDEALDVRFRLATMRGQLEKFQANYEYMEEKQQLLGQVLGKIQGFEVLDMDDGEGGNGTGGDLDVIGIIRAQEDERKRLARSMHDGPAQSLTNFILQAEICQRLFDRSPDRAAEELNNLKLNASSTFQKVRDFIFDLRPMMLDDLGVAPTVRRYVESYGEKNDIDVALDIQGEERLENYREVLVFRSVQDLMGMARDYGAPTEISVNLSLTTDPIRVIIEDNGRGFNSMNIFDPDYEDPQNDARIQALRMLRSTVELVGGTIDVRSDENDGTIVRVEIPVE